MHWMNHLWLEHVRFCFRVSGLERLDLLPVLGIICRKDCCARMEHLHMAMRGLSCSMHSNHLESIVFLVVVHV
jgi:hypothetical protein